MYGMAGINGSALKMGEGDREYAELDPDAPLEVDRNDISMMQDASHACLQNVNFNKIRYAACKYTRTKDKDFIMDRHTENANVLMFSPCSGHGFKYGPLYGEIAEAMIKGQENSLPFDIQSFSLSRFD
jgi:sarcosine oxidase